MVEKDVRMPPTTTQQVMDQPSTKSNDSESNPLKQVGMDRKIPKKNWPPKKIAVVAAAAAFVIFVLYSFVFRDASSRLNVDTDRITISTVERGPFQEFIPVTGTILPQTSFYLDAILGGTVEKKFVEEGAMLKKGDKILQLSNTTVQLSALQQETFTYQQINDARNTRLQIEQNSNALENALVSANYGLTNGREIFARQKALWEKKLISLQDFQQAENNYHLAVDQQALAQQNFSRDSLLKQNQLQQIGESIDRLQKNLALIRDEIENLTVRAPISGQLTSLNAETGQSKSPGDRLGQIDALENFKVRADIDEFYISRINSGQTGEFDLSDTTYKLIIKKVYPEVTNGRFQVDLYFVGQVPKGIRRGQTLQIRLELGELSEALLLPRGGFYQKTGGQWVYVLDAAGDYAVKRAIKLGRQNPQMFEVLEGLAPGDRVITSSYDTFGDNDKLVLKN
jgi:HlyD family secretion protein